MMHVYLRHENAAGSGDDILVHPGKSYFLPNVAPDEHINLVEKADDAHSATRLGGNQAC
jgi:hypothetical protein